MNPPPSEPAMATDTFTVALVTRVFPTEEEWALLPAALREARSGGAEMAVLPELPLNPWSPATRDPREDDAEEVDGPRQRVLAGAAREAGMAVMGGAIIRDPDSGARHNTALLYDASGSCLARYRKVHLPAEEGFWETSHYESGPEPPTVVRGLPMAIGLQICSDVNRPTGSELLAAMGAEVVLAPRCTPLHSYERWKMILRANAVTGSAYVLSANRPGPEKGVPIGGSSLAVAPDGAVLLEAGEGLGVITLSREAVKRAKADYPGYLERFPDVYARGWEGLK